MDLKRVGDCVWEIPKSGAMRVPGRIYADKRLLDLAKGDKALDQVVNVATLPGIVKWSLAMPDIHWGYGFPIGGVAAFDADEGVISPGGVGYDINCLAGDTQVLLPGSGTRSLSEIVESRYQGEILHLVDGEMRPTRVRAGLSRAPGNPVRELVTVSGRRVVGTEDHLILTRDGWRELGSVARGVRIAAVQSGDVFWDAVESVTSRPDVTRVYDIEVESPHHNFVAGGLVVHNCGVRVCKTGLRFDELEGKHKKLVNALFNAVPTGVGGDSAIGRLSKEDGARIVTQGAKWAVEHGYATPADLEHTEDGGTMPGADPAAPSDTAFRRGMGQVGTLGSGNHFLELDRVVEVYGPEAESVFGLREGDVVLLIHCGSRGFGYQICDENVHDFVKIAHRYHIDLVDKQLACAPAASPEGRQYLSAMACAANYAWVNRQVIQTLAGKAIGDCLGKKVEPELIYDVCHNIAKVEEHEVDGKMRKVIVHRKGATRAFPPGHPLTPGKYKEVGQPVLVPGDMGRSSYLLTGLPGAMKETFGSTCHGAGRLASRGEMNRRMSGVDLDAELRAMGVTVRGKTRSSLAEEMPSAYKDAGIVTEVMERAGISKRIAKFVPFAVIKG
ncbi:MAG: RtcB family protein [Planctomycetia bacterium]|nr:RtcB family protein [Planctomycetia bacterium]